MAEEKYFSFERTLVDLLGFVKKFLITVYHSIFYPKKLIDVTYHLQQVGDKHEHLRGKLPDKINYIDAFLYFSMSVILTFSFYRTKLFVNTNNLVMGFKEQVSASMDYLTETTLLQKMYICLPIIIGIFLILRILLSRLKSKKERRPEFLYVRPVFYYSFGTLILAFIFIDYLSISLELKKAIITSDTLSLLFSLGYISWFCYHLFWHVQKNVYKGVKKRKFIHYQITLLLLFLLIFMPFLLKFGYQQLLGEMGQLEYEPQFSIIGLGKNNAIQGSLVDSTNNKITFNGACLIKNNGKQSVHIMGGNQSRIGRKNDKGRIEYFGDLELYSDDSLSTKTKKIDPGEMESFQVKILLTSDQYNLYWPSKDSIVQFSLDSIKCFPYSKVERFKDNTFYIYY